MARSTLSTAIIGKYRVRFVAYILDRVFFLIVFLLAALAINVQFGPQIRQAGYALAFPDCIEQKVWRATVRDVQAAGPLGVFALYGNCAATAATANWNALTTPRPLPTPLPLGARRVTPGPGTATPLDWLAIPFVLIAAALCASSPWQTTPARRAFRLALARNTGGRVGVLRGLLREFACAIPLAALAFSLFAAQTGLQPIADYTVLPWHWIAAGVLVVLAWYFPHVVMRRLARLPLHDRLLGTLVAKS